MNRITRPLATAITVALGLSQSAAFAQTETAVAPKSDKTESLDTVIVTGTHVSNRTAAESQSPIDIITPQALQSTGTTELATALSRVLPSLNFPRPSLSEGTTGVRPAQLRSLAPDQVLVLINGKRRHSASLINVGRSIGRGSSAVDFNAIPMSAIERIEVLRDGASAQYGSDAIAGVINIILKGSGKGGSLMADHGRYSRGDGSTNDIAGDGGVDFAGGRGSLHVAAQLTKQKQTDRAEPYQGPTPNTGGFPGLGQKAYVFGEPAVDSTAVSANSKFSINDSISAYATAIVSNRDILSGQFYRSRNHSGQTALLSQVYPNGYLPMLRQYVKDRSIVIGLDGSVQSGLNWDISYNHGTNIIDYWTLNTINYSLGVQSPRRFYDGSLQYTQDIVDANVNIPLQWGLAYSSTFSAGVEYRREQWDQNPGIPSSYFGTGAQGFAGFSSRNRVNADRHNYAVYTGLEMDFTDRFSAGLAARYEKYSDFGSKTSGKLSGRYAFTDKFAIRATASNGFRAPSLSQQGYQSISTVALNGRIFDKGTFPTTSAAGKALGARPLKAETSTSFSVGFVLEPVDRLFMTLDAYQIKIKDRINFSSTTQLTPAAQARLTALGITPIDSFAYYVNAFDTRTRGAEFVGTYSLPLSTSTLDVSAAYSYNKTKVERVQKNPPILTSLNITQPLTGRDATGRIEGSYPKSKVILNGLWKLQHWDFGLTTTRYDKITAYNQNPSLDQTFSAAWIVDASVSYRPSDSWTLTVGGDNVFNKYPDKIKSPINSLYGASPYSSYSPWGFNGAYVYARVKYTW